MGLGPADDIELSALLARLKPDEHMAYAKGDSRTKHFMLRLAKQRRVMVKQDQYLLARKRINQRFMRKNNALRDALRDIERMVKEALFEGRGFTPLMNQIICRAETATKKTKSLDSNNELAGLLREGETTPCSSK